MMARWRFALVLLLGVLAGYGAAAQEVLRVGYFSLPPHVVTPEGRPAEVGGPAVDHLQEVARRMGVRLQISRYPLPLDRLLQELRDGQLDVALALGRNAEREAFLQFPAQPFFLMQPAIAVRHDALLHEVRTQGDLFGLRIGIYSSGYLSPLMRHPEVKRDPLFGDRVTLRNLGKLESRRIDAVYSPDRSDLLSAASASGAKVRVLDLPEPASGLYTAFAAHVGAGVVRRYEAALGTIRPYESTLAGNLAVRQKTRR